MKILPCILAAALSLSAIAEEAVRKWKEAGTERTIEGAIQDKKSDGSGALIRLTDGRNVWVETSKFSEPDQTYIKNWVPDQDVISTRWISTGGNKIVEIKCRAGVSKVTIKSQNPNHYWLVKVVEAGQTAVFQVPLGNSEKTYNFFAERDGVVVDRETNLKKTGIAFEKE